MGYKPVFNLTEEMFLVNKILENEAKMYGFTALEVRALAFDLAVKLNKPNNFDKETKLAGLEWFRGFMKRHPELSLRKPEPTSAARAAGFNKHAVNSFYELLDDIYNSNNFEASRIYNMDETGVSCNPKSNSKVLSLKGKRQVGTRTSAERGTNVTAVICFSASGQYMPPLLIFPRKIENRSYLKGAPAGSWAEFNSSGWMEDKIFTKWLKYFIDSSGSIKEKPVLLLLDGHATHVKNLEAIEVAQENGVVMLCFPPHCTHRMQPLDVDYMKPLSNFYSAEISKWMRENPGCTIALKEIYSIFGKAFTKASTMDTAVNAFRRTGIKPFDRDVFKDEDFVASSTNSTSTTNSTLTNLTGKYIFSN